MPAFRPCRNAVRTLVASLLLVTLAGCGSAGHYRDANNLFADGNYVEALREYEQALAKRPKDVRYRQQYLLKKNAALEVLFRDAARARNENDLSRAEGLYQQALQVEPGNAVATEWLRRIADMRRQNEELVKIDELISAGDLGTAEQLVRNVLTETPGNLRAQNSLDRIRSANAAQRSQEGSSLHDRFKKPVTLEFRDVPVKAAFEVLSQASGINFVYDQDIRPDLKVTVFLRKTPLDEAVRLIGLSTQLETRVLNANSVLVFPSTPQKINDYRQLSVRSFYLANADARKVAETLKALLKTESIVVDEKLNLLMMRDSPEAIRLAEKIVALQDIGEPEVMLDVEVLEIKRSKLLDLGISLPNEIGVSLTAPGQTGNSISLSNLRGLNSNGIYASVPSASIKLHDERSDARILANPKIRVKSREKASVLIGDRVPVITSTSTSTGFVSETVNYVDVGLKLEVEPAVFVGDEVSIKINLEVSNLVREIVTRSGTLSYQIGTRNAQTILRLKDGEMQILAGLINKEDRRVANGWPGISRFPILNRIFGSQKSDRQDTEIVLSIRPRLVRGVRQADLDEIEFESGTATHLGGSRAVPAAMEPAEGTTEGAAAAGDAPSAASPVAVPTSEPVQPQPIPSSGGALFDWSAPTEVKVGEQFTAVLNVSTSQPVDQIPMMLGFDPQVLQVVNVEEGSFMSQGGGQSTLAKQVNLSDGKISATVVRQGTAVSGQGALLQVTFKALAAAEKTQIRLLAATPGPDSKTPARLADANISIR